MIKEGEAGSPNSHCKHLRSLLTHSETTLSVQSPWLNHAQIQPGRWPACVIRIPSKGWEKSWKHLFLSKISRAGEMYQSAKCLPCVEEDLSLIPKIHIAPVIPRLGKQRQADLWSSLVTQPSLLSKLCQWETLPFLACIYQKDSSSIRSNTKNDTKYLFPPSMISLKMTRDRPAFHGYLPWPQPKLACFLQR